jgi:two-component system, chemotaxis family, chemotaxis protein CheY
VKTILVVDDDSSIRSMIRLMLEGAGYEVIEAEHGAVALQRIARSRPDLLITNLMMPKVDGIRLIRQLRSRPDTTSLRILAISGHPEAVEYAHQANALLAKPFFQDQLLASIRSLIGDDSAAP